MIEKTKERLRASALAVMLAFIPSCIKETERVYKPTEPETQNLKKIDYNCPRQVAFTITDDQRQKTNKTADGWQKLYDSIKRAKGPEVYHITTQEEAYLNFFMKLNEDSQKAIFNNPLLEKFPFLNRNNPSVRDIVFLYHLRNYNPK